MGTKRKPIPKAVQDSVLVPSRRRCALCFHLNGDLTEKRGQIAHIDRNAANHTDSNLVFLCLDHHTQYDSTASQHKNITRGELVKAKCQLEQAIAEGRHNKAAIPFGPGRDTDRKALDDLIGLMTGTNTIRLLRDPNFGGCSFAMQQFESLDTLAKDLNEAEHEFIDPNLEALRKDLRAASEAFLVLFIRNTKRTAHTPGYRAVSQDDGRFDEMVSELDAAADKLCTIYDELVRTGRKRLAL